VKHRELDSRRRRGRGCRVRPADNAQDGRVAGGWRRVSTRAGDQPAGDRRRRHAQHRGRLHTPTHRLPRHQHRRRYRTQLLRRARVPSGENRPVPPSLSALVFVP